MAGQHDGTQGLPEDFFWREKIIKVQQQTTMTRELDEQYKTHHSKHRKHNGGGRKSRGVQEMG